jgi:hypothetical protein
LAGWLLGGWVIGLLLMGTLDGSLLGQLVIWPVSRLVDRMVFWLFVRSDGR